MLIAALTFGTGRFFEQNRRHDRGNDEGDGYQQHELMFAFEFYLSGTCR
jgi:hypothetical protein